jgi:hypothetical protein
LVRRTHGIPDEEKPARIVASRGDDVDPVVPYLVAATNGILYKHPMGLLHDYPISEIRLAGG